MERDELGMFADHIEYQKMDTWGSVITPHRWGQLPSIKKIEKVLGKSIKNQQVGNVTGWLRDLREFDLIKNLEEEIEDYNKSVEFHNKEVAEWQRLKKMIAKASPAMKREAKRLGLRQMFEVCDWNADSTMNAIRQNLEF